MCLFPCEAYDSRKGGQTHHPKRNGKKKPWAQTNNSLPNNHVRHNEASFNSTKWRCPYDNVTYCKFTPNRKQLPKQLPPPLHMARTWMDMHRLRRLHDSQYIMKNPFTNENSNLSNIFHNNIHRKKVESLKVRSTEEFLCQFAWLPCRFFRGRRQGRQPLKTFTGQDIKTLIRRLPATGTTGLPQSLALGTNSLPLAEECEHLVAQKANVLTLSWRLCTQSVMAN